MSQPLIALTTDFGQADGYVGTMKGIILGICPQATLVDITHEINPQAVGQAAYVLHAAAPYFPPGTVHLVVVDPGVGSTRRAVVVQTKRATYVAPDNGVLSMALTGDPARIAIHLTEPKYRLPQVSATFHGRDVFAPAAAHLACGVPPHDMGQVIPLSSLVTLPMLQPEPQEDGSWRGEVLYVDLFGNLVTNLRPAGPDARLKIEIGGERVVGLCRTFADAAPGTLVSYIGSSGYLEVAVREGNAAERLHVAVGAPVRLNERSRSGSERD